MTASAGGRRVADRPQGPRARAAGDAAGQGASDYGPRRRSGRLRIEVAAAEADGAVGAVGAAGVTDDAAVLDEVDVGLEHLVGLEHAEEELVGVVGGGLRSDQA